MSVEREPRWTTIRPRRTGLAPIDDVTLSIGRVAQRVAVRMRRDRPGGVVFRAGPGGWGLALILFSAALCVAWGGLLFWVLLRVVIPLI
jgi:hypothetical protein